MSTRIKEIVIDGRKGYVFKDGTKFLKRVLGQNKFKYTNLYHLNFMVLYTSGMYEPTKLNENGDILFLENNNV
jgi:hypothetical protein